MTDFVIKIQKSGVWWAFDEALFPISASLQLGILQISLNSSVIRSHYSEVGTAIHIGCSTFQMAFPDSRTWSDNKLRELIAVKVLHTSLSNTTAVAFKGLPLGSYAPIPAPSPLFKTILELVLWIGLQSCRCITPDVINVIKIPSFQYFLYLWEQKKVTGG